MKCCDMTSGQLRTPVTFERQQETDIGGGATEIAWAELFTTRCRFKATSGSERMQAERLDATTRNRIVIRYRSDLTESDRAIIRGRAYQIRFINNIELRDKWLEIDLDGGVAT